MGPILAIPSKAGDFLHWVQRAKARHGKVTNERRRLRYIARVIRRANPDRWPAVAAYLRWQSAAVVEVS